MTRVAASSHVTTASKDFFVHPAAAWRSVLRPYVGPNARRARRFSSLPPSSRSPLDGVVSEVLPRAMVRVELNDGHRVLAHEGGQDAQVPGSRPGRRSRYRHRLPRGSRIDVSWADHGISRHFLAISDGLTPALSSEDRA
jgi:hypothetical protein